MENENVERFKLGLEPFFQNVSACLVEMEFERDQIPNKVLLLMRRLVKKGVRLERSLGNPHFYKENHILLKVEEIAEVVDLLKLEMSDTTKLSERWKRQIEQIYTMICRFLMNFESSWAS